MAGLRPLFRCSLKRDNGVIGIALGAVTGRSAEKLNGQRLEIPVSSIQTASDLEFADLAGVLCAGPSASEKRGGDVAAAR